MRGGVPMSHYRLTLTIGRGEYDEVGDRWIPAKLLFEVHKATSQLEHGWGQKLRASKAVSAHVRICYTKEEKCELYQAWLAQRDAHEDDIEAEALWKGIA